MKWCGMEWIRMESSGMEWNGIVGSLLPPPASHLPPPTSRHSPAAVPLPPPSLLSAFAHVGQLKFPRSVARSHAEMLPAVQTCS
jgi:hypothetical protein